MSRAGYKILIVEDEASMARAIKDNLVAVGYQVAMASNGEEGLAQIAKEDYNVVLLDISMPQMDGMEMMKKMREVSANKIIPIIIYTNMIPDAAILHGVSRDKPTYYLSKTEHSIETLVGKIDEVIGVI